MVAINNFTLTWFYTPDTKLAITFETVGANLLTTSLNSNNGMSASVQENYQFDSQITTHPVESGLAVSDYIIIQPTVISITGLLTAINSIPIVGTGILDFSQLGNATKFLFDAAKSRQLFTLVTGLYFGRGFYKAEHLAIKSLNIPRNFEFGRTSIKFNIVFQEVLITDTNPPQQNSSTNAVPDSSAPGVT